MSKKIVAVLFGGMSSEYEVSLASASAVLENISREKYLVLPIGITRDGDWFRYGGSVGKIAADRWWEDPMEITPVAVSVSRSGAGFLELRGEKWVRLGVDAVLPVLHGRNGEDGTVQGMLELAGMSVVGCGTLASALGMDKERAHELVRAAGIPVPESITVDRAGAEAGVREAERLGLPVFVKPARAGSSFGVTRVERPEDLPAAVEKALSFDSRAIVERAVEGFEVGCAIMGREKLIVGRVDEIELEGGFFDFEEKYHTSTAKIHMPARVDPETEKRIRDTAVKIYRALDCSGLARVDMFLTPEGEIVFNEVNTVPGLTGHSRFPAMMRGIGLDFSDMLDRLLEMYV